MAQDEEHFDRASCVGATTVENSTAAVGILIDDFGDFLVFVGNDAELYGTAHHIDDVIHKKGGNEKIDLTVDHHFPVFQYEIAGSDDNDIYQEDDMPQ